MVCFSLQRRQKKDKKRSRDVECEQLVRARGVVFPILSLLPPYRSFFFRPMGPSRVNTTPPRVSHLPSMQQQPISAQVV